MLWGEKYTEVKTERKEESPTESEAPGSKESQSGKYC